MKKNWKGVIIDYLILSFLAFLLVNFMRYTNEKFGWPRIVYLCIMIVCIPISWGTLSHSSEGKRTIGYVIADKINKKNKVKDTNSK